nr:helix-turn-helix transcriptional regulator [Pantoea sp. 201603H]
MINHCTGKLIKKIRVEKGFTGSALGELTGLSQQQVSRYERGLSQITLIQLVRILIVLDISLEDFFYQLGVICGFSDARDMLMIYGGQKDTDESNIKFG